jgi:hypothetical protein
VRVLSTPTRRLVGSVVALAIGTLLWGATDDADAGDRPHPLSTTTPERRCASSSTAPADDLDRDGCTDVVTAAGNRLVVDGVTYRAGADGDVVAVAPIGCGDAPSVLLLRPATGEVFQFVALPEPGRPSTAELVATVTGATSLHVATEPCAHAVARSTDGPASAVPIDSPTTPDHDEDDRP